jgi:hypothetical protein
MADTMGHILAVRNKDDEDFTSFFPVVGTGRTAYGFAFDDLKLEIAVSPDSNFYVEKVAFSRGANFADANKNIQMMRYKFSQTDTTLNLDDRFELPLGGKWRAQRLKVRIYVPEGKRITFAGNIDQVRASVKGNDYFDNELPGKTLQVMNGKIKCIDCKEKVIMDEEIDGPEPPEAPDTTATKKAPHMSVNIDQHSISVVGKGDKNEKIDIHINDRGIKVLSTDSNGNKIVTKK